MLLNLIDSNFIPAKYEADQLFQLFICINTDNVVILTVTIINIHHDYKFPSNRCYDDILFYLATVTI